MTAITDNRAFADTAPAFHVSHRSGRRAGSANRSVALRGHDLPVGIPAVPGAADHCEADPPVVRWILGGVDHRTGVLPVDAARRLRVCRSDAAPGSAAPGAAACRTAAAVPADPADPRVAGLEAAGRRGADRAHPAAARRHDRTAVLPSLDHDTAAAGLVLATVPHRSPLPAVRPLQLRVPAGAARLPGAVRAMADPAPARLDLVAAVQPLRAHLRRDRVALAACRACRRCARPAARGSDRRGRYRRLRCNCAGWRSRPWVR